MDYEGQLLKLLTEKYRKSKKDAGTNRIKRRTQIKPSQLYTKYCDNDGDFAIIEAIGEAVRACERRGFVTYEMKGFGYEIAAVYLNDDRITEVEQYLNDTCGYETKEAKLAYVRNLIEKYGQCSPAAAMECARMQEDLKQRRLPKNYAQKEDVLKALIFVENNKQELYVREASMLIYGSSKYFEENTLDTVCRLLRNYLKKPCGEGELPDEILEQYHIRKEAQRLCMKGNCTIYRKGQVLEVGALENGIEFAADEVPEIERVETGAQEFLTVENKTSYLRCPAGNMVVFYLGGYATRYQRDFIKKVWRDNPGLSWSHFGDIDAGGFFIHEHLCRITEIPFKMKYMSVGQLQDERFAACLQKLKPSDRRRLKTLQEKEAYKDTVEYMLKENVKLEQEIVSYYLEREN